MTTPLSIDRADFSDPEFNAKIWLENILNNQSNDLSKNATTINHLSQIVLKLGVYSNDCESNLSSINQQLINATKRSTNQFADLQRDTLMVRQSINQSINQFDALDRRHHSVVNNLSILDSIKQRLEETDRLARLIDENRKKERSIKQAINQDDIHRMTALVQSIKQSNNQSDHLSNLATDQTNKQTNNQPISSLSDQQLIERLIERALIVPDQVLIDRLIDRLKELSESKIKQSLIDRDLLVLSEYEDVVRLIDRLIDINQLYTQSRDQEIDQLINQSIKQSNNDQDQIISTFDRLIDWLIDELIWCERAFPHPNQTIICLIDRLIKKASKPFAQIMSKYVDDRSVTQSINQPTQANKHSTSQSTSQITNQSAQRPIEERLNFIRSVNQSMNQFADRLIGLIDRFITQPQGDEILFSIKQSVSLSSTQFIRLYTSFINQTINSFDLGSNQSINLSNNVVTQSQDLSTIYQSIITDCLIDCAMNAAPELCALIDQTIDQYYTRINQSVNRVRDFSIKTIKQSSDQSSNQSINQCDDEQLYGFFNLLAISCSCLFDDVQTNLINQSIKVIGPSINQARVNPLLNESNDQSLNQVNPEINIRILATVLKHDQTRLDQLIEFINQCTINQPINQSNVVDQTIAKLVSQPTSDSIRQLFPLSSAGHKKLIDNLTESINQYLFAPLSKKVSSLKQWYKQSINQSVEVKADGSEDQILLPSFSVQPSESICMVGEYLLAVLQQIDQSINQSINQPSLKRLNGQSNDSNEQSSINQSISFDQDYDTSFFMSHLSTNICQSIIQSIQSFRSINQSVRQSILADLDYLINVLSAMTIDVPHQISVVKQALQSSKHSNNQSNDQFNDKDRALYDAIIKLM